MVHFPHLIFHQNSNSCFQLASHLPENKKHTTFENNIGLCHRNSSVMFSDVNFFFFESKDFLIFLYYYYYFYFTILYWFCHTSTCICHGCTRVPHPEPSSHLPSHTIPLGHPSAPAPSFLYPASNLDWRFISYMILYMF